LRHNEIPVPKQVAKKELDAILSAVARVPAGGSVEKIGAALDRKIPRRTLQRRLALLVKQKRLTVEGRARGSRYRLPPSTVEARGAASGSSTVEGRGEIYIPISPRAEAIKQEVRKPIQRPSARRI
jgi:hypothetical protein